MKELSSPVNEANRLRRNVLFLLAAGNCPRVTEARARNTRIAFNRPNGLGSYVLL